MDKDTTAELLHKRIYHSDVFVLRAICRKLKAKHKRAKKWNNCCKVDDQMYKLVLQKCQVRKTSRNRYPQRSLQQFVWESVCVRLICVTSDRYDLPQLPNNPCPNPPYKVYGRFATLSAKTSKHKLWVARYRSRQDSWWPAITIERPLCDKDVQQLVPSAGAFGRLQILTDVLAATSSQFVTVPEDLGPGVRLDGDVLSQSTMADLLALLYDNREFVQNLGQRPNCAVLGHLICEVRQYTFSSLPLDAVEQWFLDLEQSWSKQALNYSEPFC